MTTLLARNLTPIERTEFSQASTPIGNTDAAFHFITDANAVTAAAVHAQLVAAEQELQEFRADVEDGWRMADPGEENRLAEAVRKIKLMLAGTDFVLDAMAECDEPALSF